MRKCVALSCTLHKHYVPNMLSFRSETDGKIQTERKMDGVLVKAIESNDLQVIHINLPNKVKEVCYRSNKVSLLPVCAVSTLSHLNDDRDKSESLEQRQHTH